MWSPYGVDRISIIFCLLFCGNPQVTYEHTVGEEIYR